MLLCGGLLNNTIHSRRNRRDSLATVDSSGKKLLESYLPEGRKGVILFVNDIVTWGKGWCFEKESVGGLNELAEYNGEEGNAGDDVLSHFENVYGVIGYNGWGEKYN
jgi:hypothetical protein